MTKHATYLNASVIINATVKGAKLFSYLSNFLWFERYNAELKTKKVFFINVLHTKGIDGYFRNCSLKGSFGNQK